MFIATEILSVSELTKQIKQTLEQDFSQVYVTGEISNFKAHNSGHWYFNLKDSNAVICCTMWNGFNKYVFFTPNDGMKVTVNGKITVYPPKGNYQIDIRSMKPAGEGELQAAFEKLKKKLASEGLFDSEFKKQIPSLPKKIGIITAENSAAVHDMISIAKRRFPLVELVICYSKVQGTGAAKNIVRSLRILNKKKDIDLIIIARGGGSIEDLWAFNEEIVAREIFNSNIPVITGVGHETDFTIADFVSDLRAPTPSAAMELATPNKEDFFAFISDFSYNSTQKLNDLCCGFKNRIKYVLDSYGFKLPIDIVRRRMQQLDNVIYKLRFNTERVFLKNKNKVALLTNSLNSHDIRKQLKKGFVLVKQDSRYVTRSQNFNNNLSHILEFFDGKVIVRKADIPNE